jgi:hypothetical protein
MLPEARSLRQVENQRRLSPGCCEWSAALSQLQDFRKSVGTKGT